MNDYSGRRSFNDEEVALETLREIALIKQEEAAKGFEGGRLGGQSDECLPRYRP